MKYIQKSQPPQDFIDWKNSANKDWQPSWGNFQKPEKTLVHKSLLQEQGFICCYCGRRIILADSHIEHFRPRNKYPDLQLDYGNLIASCEIDTDEPPPIPVHCGHRKGAWHEENLTVSPLESNCANFFRYTEDGQIIANKEIDKKEAAKTTIEKLDLNIHKLRKMRKAAIEGILDGLDLTDSQTVQKLIQGFSKPDLDGGYEEFCQVIIYILKQYSR
ncbi:MAG: retron system putative HNH endonuclease [Cyanobacteria bacterium P01_G01_bin.39]